MTLLWPLALCLTGQLLFRTVSATYTGLYYSRTLHTSTTSTLTTHTRKGFSRCASDCDYYYWVTNQATHCQGFEYDMATGECVLRSFSLEMIPLGATVEVMLRSHFTRT